MADRDRASSGSRRERIETPTGSRYVERDREGRFKEAQDEPPRRAQGNRVDREDDNDIDGASER